ncbi:hypothetical protein NMG60_11006264 [Bertholletia excelsa]
MRPTNTTAAGAGDSGFRHWNSPIPYLFGGLALMLGLIAFALVVLFCSYKNTSGSGSPGDAEEEKSGRPSPALKPEMEPRIDAVLMPGDENPTYLAKLVACTHHGDEQV